MSFLAVRAWAFLKETQCSTQFNLSWRTNHTRNDIHRQCASSCWNSEFLAFVTVLCPLLWPIHCTLAIYLLPESSFSSNSCCPVSSSYFYSGLSSSTSLNRDSTSRWQKLCDYSEGGLSRLFFSLFLSLLKTFTHQLCVQRLTFPWANQNMHKETQRIFFLLQMFKWHT